MDDHADNPGPPPAETLDPVALTRDWATLWQSELAALATDREMQEAWQTLVGLWAEVWSSAAAAMLRPAAAYGRAAGAGRAPGDERVRPSRPAGAAAAPGAATAAAASDAGDAALGELRRRLTELEQRLARYERAAASRRPRPRRRPGGSPPGGGGRSA